MTPPIMPGASQQGFNPEMLQQKLYGLQVNPFHLQNKLA